MSNGDINKEHLTDHDLLIRIDERVTTLYTKIHTLDTKLTESYVTRNEFVPVKAIVFGLVAIILTAVVGAIVALVVV